VSRVWHVAYLVVTGIIGGWVGYWIGHAAGLSEDAEWPWHVGGGTGAVLLSVVMAVVFVLVAQWASKKPE
jgi:hypothetical protein